MSSLFGLDQSNRLVFVDEVPRGLACACRCVSCQEPLIARQGAQRGHHFAHASGREPCEASHESLLHRYAKELIQEAGGLRVPADAALAATLELQARTEGAGTLSLAAVEEERAVGILRPDLLGYQASGQAVAIEVAYSSFCDEAKISQFEHLSLPALEVDLRAHGPEGFDPASVRAAVLDSVDRKVWLWPRPCTDDGSEAVPAAPDCEPACIERPPGAGKLPEQIVVISGRWVSIKTFPDGDISIKSVRYDPDVVSIVRTVAKSHAGRYSPRWHSWTVPRWRAADARRQLEGLAREVVIEVAATRHT